MVKKKKIVFIYLFIFALLAGEVERCNQLPVHAASKVCSLIICNINTLHECTEEASELFIRKHAVVSKSNEPIDPHPRTGLNHTVTTATRPVVY